MSPGITPWLQSSLSSNVIFNTEVHPGFARKDIAYCRHNLFYSIRCLSSINQNADLISLQTIHTCRFSTYFANNEMIVVISSSQFSILIDLSDTSAIPQVLEEVYINTLNINLESVLQNASLCLVLAAKNLTSEVVLSILPLHSCTAIPSS